MLTIAPHGRTTQSEPPRTDPPAYLSKDIISKIVYSRSRFPYAYLVSTSLKLQPLIYGIYYPIGCSGTIKKKPNLERDGRCVQNLVKLHRNVLIFD